LDIAGLELVLVTEGWWKRLAVFLQPSPLKLVLFALFLAVSLLGSVGSGVFCTSCLNRPEFQAWSWLPFWPAMLLLNGIQIAFLYLFVGRAEWLPMILLGLPLYYNLACEVEAVFNKLKKFTYHP